MKSSSLQQARILIYSQLRGLSVWWIPALKPGQLIKTTICHRTSSLFSDKSWLYLNRKRKSDFQPFVALVWSFYHRQNRDNQILVASCCLRSHGNVRLLTPLVKGHMFHAHSSHRPSIKFPFLAINPEKVKVWCFIWEYVSATCLDDLTSCISSCLRSTVNVNYWLDLVSVLPLWIFFFHTVEV